MRGVTKKHLSVVKWACERSARVVNRKMRRGVDSLAVISATAPLVGILGMLSGTPHALNGLVHPCGECSGGPAELFVLPALGLLIASAAMLFHGILSVWGERFRIEMKAGSLQLLNDLVRPSTHF